MGEKRSKQTRSVARRIQLLEAARRSFAEQGYEATTMRDIASAAGCSLGLSYNYFPDKSSYALAIYSGLAADLEERVVDLPEGSLGQRFAAAMELKLSLLEPHREALLGLLPVALQTQRREGVLGAETEWIRARVSAVFRQVLRGASNAPSRARLDRATGVLYGVHLLLVLLWSQDTSDGRSSTRAAIELCAEILDKLSPLRFLPGGKRIAKRIDSVLAAVYETPGSTPDADLVRQICQVLQKRHRAIDASRPRGDGLLHAQISRFVTANEAIHLVLPAFPAKSPNPEKVLGSLPDLAESVALQSLSDLCEEITALYPPGAQLTICSDGHVFADVVGVDDGDVERYRHALNAERRARGHARLRLFDLTDVYGATPPAEARARMLACYGEDPEALKAQIKSTPSLKQMFNGVHRFMTEDGFIRHPELSRSAVRKRCKGDTVEVMRRSRAWGALLRDTFPEAVRLSIHPQVPGSSKFGIHLIPTADAWLTPWHGVAVVRSNTFELMKRADAEALGAKLVFDGDAPSHMEL